MLLYLHGFRSTPQSRKAQQIAARMAALGRADEYVCPQLPASPRAAAQLLEDIAARVPVAQLAVIGSSLGGYYATWLA
ncbi:MAG: YqiA/YcfP family alpha/beta fold hydrolase, partial [Betaproteobacteria bacterium]